MAKIIGSIAALVTIIAIVIGVYVTLEDRYAHRPDVQAIDKRLDQKIRSDKVDALQARYWKFEDRYGKEPADPVIKQDMREQMVVIQKMQDEIVK
jgi:hypothetical protein